MISNLTIRRDRFFAVATWLENYDCGRHQNFPVAMTDEEIKAAITGGRPTVIPAAQNEMKPPMAATENPAETIERKAVRHTEIRRDKRKLRAVYLAELKRSGIDLSGERKFSVIEKAYEELQGKTKNGNRKSGKTA